MEEATETVQTVPFGAEFPIDDDTVGRVLRASTRGYVVVRIRKKGEIGKALAALHQRHRRVKVRRPNRKPVDRQGELG